MRTEWIPLSAAALVTGVMALVLGSLLNPLVDNATASQTIEAAKGSGGRWVTMSVMYFFGSVALTLGMPTLLSLFNGRGRSVGLLGVAVFAIGIVGMAGFGMLMVFYRALLLRQLVSVGTIDKVLDDPGLVILLGAWIGGFLLGILLIAFALFRARKTAIWVPVLMLVFVGLTPVADSLGRAGSAIQLMILAAAFTGVATSASSPEHRAELQRGLA
jgi:hypothetical protein